MKFFDQSPKDTTAIDKLMNTNSHASPETEKQGLGNDELYDLSEEHFKEINPMGLLLADLKKNLQKEVEELEAEADQYKVMGKDEKLINDLYDQAIMKHKWIMKIDSYLSKDSEIVEDFKIDKEQFESNLN